MRIDSFSGPAADLRGKDRTPENVLAALRQNPRVSTWDMSEHPWLCACIAELEQRGAIVAVSEQYPWRRWVVMESSSLQKGQK